MCRVDAPMMGSRISARMPLSKDRFAVRRMCCAGRGNPTRRSRYSAAGRSTLVPIQSLALCALSLHDVVPDLRGEKKLTLTITGSETIMNVFGPKHSL